MIKIVPLSDSAVLSMEPCSSFIPAFDTIEFELKMFLVLVGKDVRKGKGNGRREERKH